MSRFKFYLRKVPWLIRFIWWRRWDLVRDVWNSTYEQMLDAQERADEIDREAMERLIKAIEKHDLKT